MFECIVPYQAIILSYVIEQSLAAKGYNGRSFVQIRKDFQAFHLFHRPLAVHVELAYGFNLVSEEIHPVRNVVGIGEYVNYSSPNGKLSRFGNKIHLLESG